ncbi:MAG: DUF4258 domain-containing protein [Spirochaetia bacterium]|jgi:hypothetical protein
MNIVIHPHAKERMSERGIVYQEIVEAIESGEQFAAKYGRTGFRRNFHFGGIWRGRQYDMKQVEAYVVSEGDSYIVITALARYY